MTTPAKIKKEKARIDVTAALDLLGANFRGDHVGGMAEWLKNAVDAYIREDTADDKQYIVFHLRMPTKKPADWEFEVIDFVGATYQEIYDDLMEWCSPDAASKGGKYDVYGGHGNGGKFHMRENFREADFYTYRDLNLTVLGFEDKEYGFDTRYKGAEVPPDKAMKIAGLERSILPKPVLARFEKGDVSFTLVRGYGPKPAPKWKDWREFIEKIRRHGQSKQLLDRVPVTVAVNGKIVIDDLDAPRIPAKPGFEKPVVKDIPSVLTLDGEDVRFAKNGESPGTLTLRTSADPFPAHGDDATLNSIAIRGKVGVIASYRVVELPGVRNFIGGRFVYGECVCPVLEQLGCKENDRKRLADNDWSIALLRWIASEVDALANKLIEQQDRDKMAAQAAVTRRLNALLNKWKNQFLEKFFVEVTIGPGQGPGAGGTGGGGAPAGDGGAGGTKGRAGEGADGGGAGDEVKRKAPKFPLVLISGHDPDPDTGEAVILDPRNEVVYQRPVDTNRNIWWINGQRPLAERLLMNGGATSERFRDYLLQRYIDIIQTYALSKKWAEGGEVNPDVVTSWILETIGKIQDSASRDLEDFLFGEPSRGEEVAKA